MTINEMHDYFDLIQDNYNKPYFISAEKDILLNRAQEQFVNNIIFRDVLGQESVPKGVQSLYGIEDTVLTNEVIRTLIDVDKAVNTDSTGTKALYSAIHARLMHILSIMTASTNSGSLTSNKQLRFIRYNDLGRFNENSFKKGSTSKPYYKVGSDGIYLYPKTNTTENLLISYIRKPIDVNISGTSSELPSSTHKKIVAMALALAGISTENEALVMMDKV